MGTQSIDVMQSEDIEQLQTDVSELETKLNALIIEFNKCSDDTTTNKGKIDTLITDMTAVNTKISGSYTATTGSGGGSASDSILKRLHDLDLDFVAVDNLVSSYHSQNTARGGGSSNSAQMNDISSVSTSSSGNAADNSAAITAVTNDDSTSTATASVTPSYSTGVTKVITIGAKGEIRGKRLARQTLNRLRK